MLLSPPDFGNLIWEMLTRTKEGMEQDMVSVSLPKNEFGNKKMDSCTLESAFPALSN